MSKSQETKIKAGDVVVLKSGSVKMTVGAVKDGFAYCKWMVEGTIMTEHVAVAALTPAI